MLKFEKKILLSEEEYKVLLGLNEIQLLPIIQKNHYYDTDSLDLNALGITCRIREKNGQYESTIKAHQKRGSDCSIVHTERILHNTHGRFFRYMKDVSYQGTLITYRLLIKKSNNITIVLDKNTYCEKTDYELEIKYDSSAEKEAIQAIMNLESYLSAKTGNRKDKDFLKRSLFPQHKSERFFERRHIETGINHQYL